MGNQLDGNFLPGSLPYKFILIVTSIICYVVNKFISLSRHSAAVLTRLNVSVQLSLFVWNNGAGIMLTDAEFLCGYQHSNTADSICSAWLSANFPQCVSTSLSVCIVVAVGHYADPIGKADA